MKISGPKLLPKLSGPKLLWPGHIINLNIIKPCVECLYFPLKLLND